MLAGTSNGHFNIKKKFQGKKRDTSLQITGGRIWGGRHGGKMWPRTHQQEQWVRRCFWFGLSRLGCSTKSALHGRGDLLVSGQTGRLAGGACPADAWDSEILSYEIGSSWLSVTLEEAWERGSSEGQRAGCKVQGTRGKPGKMMALYLSEQIRCWPQRLN